MNRTDVVLPEFTRLLWSSAQAQSVWEPRIGQIVGYFIQREKETCKQGRCTIQVVHPNSMPELVEWATENNLVVTILNVENQTASYRSTPPGYTKGHPHNFKVVISPSDKAKRFVDAYRASDHREIGNLLSFPPCCTRFFQNYWVDQRYVDTTWPMGLTSHAQDDRTGGCEIFIDEGIDECNILLRWASVRAVPHLPCSFFCKQTKMFSDWFHDKNSQEYAWIMEMLSWPVEWSALHGIARVKTPIFEISTRTDHTDMKYLVRRRGHAYPPEGARGLVFPFRSGPEQEARLWTDNGFQSLLAMEAAHETVLSVANSLTNPLLITDLGCGNGYLLTKLAKQFPMAKLVGVDYEEKWKKPSFILYLKERIEDSYIGMKEAGAALISANRFEEIDLDVLMKVLSQYSELIVYSYNGKVVVPPGWMEVVKIAHGQNNASLYRRAS